MALYEYRCKECDRRFETMRAMADKDAPAPCPACGSVKSMRQLSVFSAKVGSSKDIGGCATSAAMNMPCCGGGCGLPRN